MKQLLPIGAMTVVAFTSCLSPSLDSEESGKLITFQALGFSIETRATLAEAQLTDLWVFDYVGDVCVQQVHQSSSASAFGSPTLSMTHGEHILKFVASKGTEPTINDDVLSWTKPHDTFATTIALTIDDETESVQTITLKRQVAKLQIALKDILPANVATFKVTLSNRSTGIDLSEMSATTPSEVTQTFQIADWAGKQDTKYSLYSLITTDDELTTGVTVSICDSEGSELISRTIPAVPLKRNRPTILTGYLFDVNYAPAISLDGDWLADKEIGF